MTTSASAATATATQPRLTARQRKAIRAAALCPGTSYPIEVLPDSDMPPTLKGEGWYRTWSNNPNGKRVWASNPKWRTYYWPSTRRIVVGDEFVAHLVKGA